MLVLTRKPNETIVVDGSIRITVLSVNGHSVRLGIVAPPDIRVDREEIHQRLQEFTTSEDGPEAVVQLVGACR